MLGSFGIQGASLSTRPPGRQTAHRKPSRHQAGEPGEQIVILKVYGAAATATTFSNSRSHPSESVEYTKKEVELLGLAQAGRDSKGHPAGAG